MIGRIILILVVYFALYYLVMRLINSRRNRRRRFERTSRGDPRARFKESGIEDADFEEIDDDKS